MNPAWSLTSCVTLGKLFDPFLPQFPHLQNGDNNSTYPQRVVVAIKLVNGCEAHGIVHGT